LKKLSIIVLLVTLIWSCSETTQSEAAESSKKSEVKMAEFSELAMLMKQIHKDAKDWRSKIVEGELVTDSIAIYSALVESTPTDADVTGPVFEGMAAAYQDKLDAFLSAKNIDLAKSSYNNLVASCVSCHQVYCPGPIPTIKKLYVSEIQ
jgi:cytochrome c556